MNRLRGERWINSSEKRAMDVLSASGVALVALPLGGLALGMSRLIDGKGAVFHQKRIGQDGREFEITKIRTMKNIDSDTVGLGPNDPRATKFGNILRNLSVDEFFQVSNIIEGTMSMTGPRANTEGLFKSMRQAVSRNIYDEWENAVFSSKPGGLSSFVLANRLGSVPVGSLEQRLNHHAALDIEDFKNASMAYDLHLLVSAGLTGLRLPFLIRRGIADPVDNPDVPKPA
jgi:lipopolysaccharide/colanic/teichoic acid biosynthesis glycosyltransferase